MTAVLYQFAGSHYCEKARWALDFKGVDFATRTLVPGPHISATRKIAPSTTVPILVIDDNKVVQGSSAIIDFLDKSEPRHCLTPTNTTDASRAVEWERYLDNNLAKPIRLLFYHYAFNDKKLVCEFLSRDAPWWASIFLHMTYPMITKKMKSGLGINPETASTAERQLVNAFDQLDDKVVPGKFLAGPLFSRADLSVAAYLFHCFSPGWTWPAGLNRIFEPLRERPTYVWAKQIYADYRLGSKQ